MESTAPKEMAALVERVKELEAEVSSLRASRDALRASHDKLEALIENTDDFILFSNAEALPVVFNRAYARVMEEMLGLQMRPGLQPHTTLPDPAARAWWEEQHRRVLSGEKFQVEFPYQPPGGPARYFEVSFNPVVREGRVVGFSEFTHEVTARRQAEEEKAELQRQLFEAQKMEALGRLAGGLAHEFNNVLAVLLGSAELLEKQVPVGDQARDQVDRMLKVTRRAREITSKLLAFARRDRPTRSPVALGGLLTDLREMLATSLTQSFRIEIEGGEGDVRVDVDAGQILLALLNLCLNAADSMPDGGEISIRSEMADTFGLPRAPQDANGDYVVIRIQDQGGGMPEDVLERAFEPFFTSKKRGRGTGLGLPVSRGIVEAHEGWIELQSAPGEGTEARVYLPSTTGVAATKPAAPPRMAAPSTLLLVDDEEDLLEVLRLHLEEEGHRVLAASSGTAAIELYRQHQGAIDAVLLDVIMPGLDGVQTLEHLRAIDPRCKVILCSAYRDRRCAQRLAALGANGSLPKPFTVDELGRALESILGAADR